MREDIRAIIGDVPSQALEAVSMLLRCPWGAIMFLRRWVAGKVRSTFQSP